jgi:16S rRNA G966 N2-methylase RsmD
MPGFWPREGDMWFALPRTVWDRAHLLGEKRDHVLTLAEVERYGEESFGDPDYVSVYGLSPRASYARGVRLRGRTAVECTRDSLADLIGRDVAEVAKAHGDSAPVIVDLFTGSANTLYWLHRHLPGSRAVGFERDDGVFASTRSNLSALGLELELHHLDYDNGLQRLAVAEGNLLIVFVAPPWGDALTDRGLDLDRTTPSVREVVDRVAVLFPRNRLLFAIQIYERVDPASARRLRKRFDWSAFEVYDIDAPGRNHGLALATIGWIPS